MIAGAGTGLLRSMYCQRLMVADLIPVDTVINLMCAVAPDIARKNAHEGESRGGSGKEAAIFNCTSGSTNPITWGDVEAMATVHLRNNPMHKMFW